MQKDVGPSGDERDPLSNLIMHKFGDLEIAAGSVVPFPTSLDELDKIIDGYLIRGAMFHLTFDKLNYLEAACNFICGKSRTPFFSSRLQLEALHKYFGLISMLKVVQLNSVPNMPNIEDDELLQLRADHVIAAGWWPENSVIVYNFGNSWLNSRLAYEYLAWMHRASVISNEFFQPNYQREKEGFDNGLQPGYHVIELPPDDYQNGIGYTYRGQSADQVQVQLTDGWQLMGWEGIQLFVVFPYYPLVMNNPHGRAPNLILAGLEVKLQPENQLYSPLTVRFSKKEPELQFGIMERHMKEPLYGPGICRYRGLLKNFI